MKTVKHLYDLRRFRVGLGTFLESLSSLFMPNGEQDADLIADMTPFNNLLTTALYCLAPGTDGLKMSLLGKLQFAFNLASKELELCLIRRLSADCDPQPEQLPAASLLRAPAELVGGAGGQGPVRPRRPQEPGQDVALVQAGHGQAAARQPMCGQHQRQAS